MSTNASVPESPNQKNLPVTLEYSELQKKLRLDMSHVNAYVNMGRTFEAGEYLVSPIVKQKTLPFTLGVEIRQKSTPQGSPMRIFVGMPPSYAARTPGEPVGRLTFLGDQAIRFELNGTIIDYTEKNKDDPEVLTKVLPLVQKFAGILAKVREEGPEKLQEGVKQNMQDLLNF